MEEEFKRHPTFRQLTTLKATPTWRPQPFFADPTLRGRILAQGPAAARFGAVGFIGVTYFFNWRFWTLFTE